jgi:hypothetical protein
LQLQGKLDARIAELRAVGKNLLADNLQAINDGFIYVVHNDDLSDEQAKKYRIADNKIGEMSRWDKDSLKAELRELDSVLGFTDEEIKKLLDDIKELTEYSEADVKKLELSMDAHMEVLSKQDLIELTCPYCNKSYSIRQDDITNAAKWKKIGDESKAVVNTFTDPPYEGV